MLPACSGWAAPSRLLPDRQYRRGRVDVAGRPLGDREAAPGHDHVAGIARPDGDLRRPVVAARHRPPGFGGQHALARDHPLRDVAGAAVGDHGPAGRVDPHADGRFVVDRGVRQRHDRPEVAARGAVDGLDLVSSAAADVMPRGDRRPVRVDRHHRRAADRAGAADLPLGPEAREVRAPQPVAELHREVTAARAGLPGVEVQDLRRRVASRGDRGLRRAGAHDRTCR